MKQSFAVFRTCFHQIVAERLTVLLWSLASGIGLIKILAVWLASDTDIIGGFSRSELISYYIFIFILQQIIDWEAFWGLREEIMDGIVSSHLLKPFRYSLFVFIREFAYKIVNFSTQLLVTIVLVFSLKSYIHFNIDLAVFIKLIPIIIIGIGITFTINLIFGYITFFITESSYVWMFTGSIAFLLGGSALPLSFFPSALQGIIKLNPFRYTYSLPAELVFNKLSPGDYAQGVIIGSLWLLILLIIMKFVWQKGLKKYTAFGN
jgi:ABC-2 type transport system permease protein